MNGMDRDVINLDTTVIEAVHRGFLSEPIEAIQPVIDEIAQDSTGDTKRPVVIGEVVGETRAPESIH